jgi:aminoglycoside phosphotransferase (APT) family kinase protein
MKTCDCQVIDPFGITRDARMTFLQKALEPDFITQKLQTCLENNSNLKRIEVKRYKPERRCLIAYSFDDFTVLGKIRAKGLDKTSYETQAYLYETGLAVPRVLGVVPELNMWFQELVVGQSLTGLLQKSHAQALMSEVADALYQLHRLSPVTSRQHTIHDELNILHDRLERVARQKPAWSSRLGRVIKACETVASNVAPRKARGIHRDFYADQVLVNENKIYLLDFDLYTMGDPALDVGNFLGHLTELALRSGNADMFLELENAFESSYLERNHEVSSQHVQTYKTLTLARHIYISTLFEDRKAFTQELLELCEERLGLSQVASALVK